ncbi:HK97 family phage prohead protease [Rubinisphaera sp.]|uniref:HK97 family phage prohead protease n=1 Tax=Rubinisphaera sp. TaxID=2024857 RepID=UPI0025F44A8F|nr:HK97 family phage prohead protease [Rubinisphaera sp.]
MKLEHRVLEQRMANTRLEKRGENGSRIEGYAAVYFNEADPENTQYRLWDDYYERIMPGAFDEAIRNDDVRCLFNHDPNQVLGRNKSETLKLSVDGRGLFYSCDCPETTIGKDVATSISRGDISGSSFGFIVHEAEYREIDGIWYRELIRVGLFDVSPVTFPAYTGTTTDIAQRSLTARKSELAELRRAKLDREIAFLELGATDSE